MHDHLTHDSEYPSIYSGWTARRAAEELFAFVNRSHGQGINESLAKLIHDAENLFGENLPESLGLLAVIVDFHCEKPNEDFMGFVGPQFISDISDHIRHQLRMLYAPGIVHYARLSSDPTYNYLLRPEFCDSAPA